MGDKREAKALQVRLPGDVYEALQFEASAKGGTMNSVVVECLQANLPHTHWTDMARYRGPGIMNLPPEKHRQEARRALSDCHTKVLVELSLLGDLMQLRASQLASLATIKQYMEEGIEISPPREARKTPRGIDAADLFATKDTNNLAKTEEKVRDVLKAMARARAEAQIELRQFYVRLEQANGGGAESS